ESEGFGLPQARDRDSVFEWIDADDASGWTDDARGEFSQPAGACADIEHMIPRFQCERADQEFAVKKLQNAGLLIGLRECGRILRKTDDAAELRHSMFLDDCFRACRTPACRVCERR